MQLLIWAVPPLFWLHCSSEPHGLGRVTSRRPRRNTARFTFVRGKAAKYQATHETGDAEHAMTAGGRAERFGVRFWGSTPHPEREEFQVLHTLPAAKVSKLHPYTTIKVLLQTLRENSPFPVPRNGMGSGPMPSRYEGVTERRVQTWRLDQVFSCRLLSPKLRVEAPWSVLFMTQTRSSGLEQ